MKALNITSWTIFFLGLIGKFFHYPTTLLMILGCLLLLIYGLITFFKEIKTNLPYSLQPLSFAFLSIYLLFRVQYWGFARYIFALTFILVATCLILYLVKKAKFKLREIILVLYFAFIFLLSFIHADKIYYIVNLNTVLNSEIRNYSYSAWDKYSWFLYIAGKQDEAVQANQNAQKSCCSMFKPCA